MREYNHIRRVAGFTLIEIMVVIFVVGISAGAVSLVVGGGGPDAELRKEVERFVTLAEFASERAILNRQPVGLVLVPPAWQEERDANFERPWRYQWQRQGPTGWQNEPGLDPGVLPASVQLDVTIEGEMWEWDETPETRLPVVVFYPSGEVTRFVIEFRDERLPDQPQHVELDDWGEVVWRQSPRRQEDLQGGF